MVYLVKRPFKSKGVFYDIGDVITDIAAIKRIKSKVTEGRLIVINTETYTKYVAFFKSKFNLDIKEACEKALGITKIVPKPEVVTKVATVTKEAKVLKKVVIKA